MPKHMNAHFLDIKTAINQCQLCVSQLPETPNPILQCSAQSKILLAGQAPGIVTHQKSRPFDDKSGERLRKWLGIDACQFYDPDYFAIVPMGFCYPGKGKSGDLPPLPLCAKTWRKQLLSQLPNIELTILIGKYAIDWHLKALAENKENTFSLSTYKNATEVIQDWQTLIRYKHIALPHPSPRNNIWLKKNPWFETTHIPQLQQYILPLVKS